MQVPTKWQDKVKTSFSRAAAAYEYTAVVQKQVAQILVSEISKHNPQTILELGVGTGFVTRQLLSLYPKALMTAVDISERMLQQLRANVSLTEALRLSLALDDMDQYILQRPYDLVCSSFALQWSKDVRKLISSQASCGILAHAVPLKGSLLSLRERGVESLIPQLFLTMEDLVSSIPSHDVLVAKIVDLHQEFSSTIDALRHLKAFGGAVSPVPPQSLFSLRREKTPCTITWSVGILVARKRVS